jgi:DNA processing protein
MPPPIAAEHRDLLALHLVPGVGPRTLEALLERFGSAAAVFSASHTDLLDVEHVGPTVAEAIASLRASGWLEKELDLMQRHEVHALVFGTPEYPVMLNGIPDQPYLLYVRGEVHIEDANAVAIVGSRRCTSYGKRVAGQLAASLTRSGFTVVSGLARGIDGAAHRAALEAGGRTLAVLAGGLSRVYPPEHADLAIAVASSGALLSESRMEQDPMAGLFHARNRIISGLSRAVVIVEAAERSGALITATHAAEQGRPVFAIPGPVDSDASGGCHALIRKGAILCRGIDDVLEELHGVSAMATAARAAESAAALPPPEPSLPAAPPPGLDEPQQKIWEFLADGIKTMDEMAQQLGLGIPQLATSLMLLEMKKAVRRLPGSRYERAR